MKSIKLVKLCLNSVGLLLEGNRNVLTKFYVNLLIQIVLLINLYIEFHASNNRAPLVFLCTYYSIVIVKFVRFYQKKDLIDQFFNFMNTNWDCYPFLSKDCQLGMEQYSRQSYWIIKCIVFIACITLAYTIQSVVIYLDEKLILTNQNSFVEMALLVLQHAAMIYCFPIGMYIDSTLALLILHCCGQVTILCHNISKYNGQVRHLRGFGKTLPRDLLLRRCSCVQCITAFHLIIAKMVSNINETFYDIVLGRILVSTIHVCLTGFYLNKNGGISNDYMLVLISFCYLQIVLLILLIFCWLGEELIQKTNEINRTIQRLEWSKFRKREIFPLIMIQLRNERPLMITAGKYFVVSLQFYTKWFIKSMSYLSFTITCLKLDSSSK